jgi:hypothetical protein
MLVFPQIKNMETPTQTDQPATTTPAAPKRSSYQNLMEGRAEIVLKNEATDSILNVSELLRDLYKSIYDLKLRIDSSQK